MPERETLERAKRDADQGKSPSTQAGEFVREEMHHVREGKHGARSTKQAIAIGLSKARRSGVKVGARRRTTSAQTRRKAQRDLRRGRSRRRPSATRARGIQRALNREGRSAASHRSLARQARSSAKRRGSADRRRAALKAVSTKGKTGLRSAARKAARTRTAHRRAA